MKQAVAAILVLSLTGCGGFSDSKWNPRNWGGKDKAATSVEPVQKPDPALLDPRSMMASVTEVRTDRSAGGVILRATGVAPGPGYWGAELVPLAEETPVDGVLVYLFRVSPPTETSVPGPTRLTAARFVADSALEDARGIVVRAESNQQRGAR